MTGPLPDRLTVSDLSRYLDNIDFQPPAALPETAAYQEAAAVLAAIDNPSALRTATGSTGAGEALLSGDLVESPAPTLLGGGRMLRLDIRRDALARLGTRDAILKTLEANPQERGAPLQQTFEACVRGDMKPLANQTVAELEQTLQATIWLENLHLPDVPSADDVRLVLSRERFAQPFRRLAGAHFAGRVSELDDLRSFVGLLEPETLSRRIRARVSRLLDIAPKPALNVFGPGGIGKSALVMRFFLEHMNLPPERRVPFAYLDFDSPFVNIKDLATIGAEIFRQLRLQFPMLPTPPASLSAQVVADDLARLLDQLSHEADQPFLLVLDTFEEVQYGGEAQAIPLFEMLNRLQAQWPFLRVLISGRVAVESLTLAGHKPTPLELSGVDQSAALAILSSSGVTSPTLAQALVKQVGRVPLSLRLAAAVVAKEGASAQGIRDLETTSYVFFAVSDEVIQGQLYERILGHLHSKELEKLAHPGLVLRSIDADVILKVLNEPCGLSIATLEDARKLYEELAKETALVTEEAGNKLQHRPDVRRTMLKLLIDKEPQKAEEIHRRAVRYYQDLPDRAAKSEELYHRLMLGERPAERSEDLYQQDIRVSLSRSLQEMPVAAQLFLSRFRYTIAPDVLAQASVEERQDGLAAKIEEMLEQGQTAVTVAARELALVSYRGSNSPLYLQDMRVRFLQGRYDDLFPLADEGLRYALEAQDQSRVLDLLCLKAWAFEEAGRYSDLAACLPYLARSVERLKRKLPHVQELAQGLRLTKVDGSSKDAQPRLEVLVPLLLDLTPNDIGLIAPLLKDVITPATLVNLDVVKHVARQLLGTRPSTATSAMRRFAEFLRKNNAMGNQGQFVRAVNPEQLTVFLSETTAQTPLIDLAGVVDDLLRGWDMRLPYLPSHESTLR